MIYRILLFYVGSLAVLLSLYPWRNVVEGEALCADLSRH
nr:General aromatic amino acid permease [Klebsiella pneumoniae]